jgi:hypothetical protein
MTQDEINELQRESNGSTQPIKEVETEKKPSQVAPKTDNANEF